MEVNRRLWDENVGVHVPSSEYDLAGFKRGRNTLHELEVEEVGPLRGRSLLHLQCHFGMDTLSWARLGARVTGVDYSPEGIRVARALAEEVGIDSRFVESNVYDLPKKLRGKFDIVYTAKGVLCWLPDLRRWARVVSRFLKPGGIFYLLETHPIADITYNERDANKIEFDVPYFDRRPIRWEGDQSYAGTKRLKNKVSYNWCHSVSEVLGSLIEAGLRIESIREFPYTYWKMYPFTRKKRDGWYHLTRDLGMIPLMWSVRARKD